MAEPLAPAELVQLVRRVFKPRPEDTAIAVLVDLPDTAVADSAAWRARREMAAGWVAALDGARDQLGLPARLFLYRNVRQGNADLPPGAWPQLDQAVLLPASADDLDLAAQRPFAEIFAGHSILIAPTELSATAPLKLAAPRYGFRAATMPGFSESMIPALRLDYDEIHRRVGRLARLLDQAEAAEIDFEIAAGAAAGSRHHLLLDLRYRQAHASSGLLTEPGTAGNLPSGEAYIVPYEGERAGDQSRSRGSLPVQLGDEVVVYAVAGNRAQAVSSAGPRSRDESALLAAEPAYGNLAELGFGVLADLGVAPTGSALLDEKLGLHIAFGRSDHFGGQVGAGSFKRAEAVVHLDRIYLPSTQPWVRVRRLLLRMPAQEAAGKQGPTGQAGPAMVEVLLDDRYVLEL